MRRGMMRANRRHSRKQSGLAQHITGSARTLLLVFMWLGLILILEANGRANNIARSVVSSNDQVIASENAQARGNQGLHSVDQGNSYSEADVLRIRSELQGSGYARLEILVGLFGILITILVLAFGFRTAQAAAQAARAEVSLYRTELDRLIEESRKATDAVHAASSAADTAAKAAAAAAETARSHADAVASHAAQASEQMDRLREAAKALSPSAIGEGETAAALSDSSGKDVQSKLILEITDAYDSDDWPLVMSKAAEIIANDESGDADLALARFFQAYATGKLGDEKAEISLYSSLVDDFIDDEDEVIRLVIARALLNIGLTHGVLANANEEDKSYDRLIERFSLDSNEEVRKRVGQAFYWKAANLADRGRVKQPISLLEKWGEFNGSFECDRVIGSSFFSPVMDSPMFRRFLQSKGCVGV